TLFPYTTLFRSGRGEIGGNLVLQTVRLGAIGPALADRTASARQNDSREAFGGRTGVNLLTRGGAVGDLTAHDPGHEERHGRAPHVRRVGRAVDRQSLVPLCRVA